MVVVEVVVTLGGANGEDSETDGTWAEVELPLPNGGIPRSANSLSMSSNCLSSMAL